MNINRFEADTHYCHRRNHDSLAGCLCPRRTGKNLKTQFRFSFIRCSGKRDADCFCRRSGGQSNILYNRGVGGDCSGDQLEQSTPVEGGPRRQRPWMGGVSLLFTCESRWSLFTFYRNRAVSQRCVKGFINQVIKLNKKRLSPH